MTEPATLHDQAIIASTMSAFGVDVPAPSGTLTYIVNLDGVTNPPLAAFSTLTDAIYSIARTAATLWAWDAHKHFRRKAPWMTTELYQAATEHSLEEQLFDKEKARSSNAAAEQIRSLERDWLTRSTFVEIAQEFLDIPLVHCSDPSGTITDADLDEDDWVPHITPVRIGLIPTTMFEAAQAADLITPPATTHILPSTR